MASPEEFPQIHAAYLKYVEMFPTQSPDPTKLIKFSKAQEIPGVSYSKCTKYFKLLNTQSTNTQSQTKGNHKKTASLPISQKDKPPLNDIANTSSSNTTTSTNTTNDTSTSSPSNRSKRAQSAVDAKNQTVPFKTVMTNELFADLKEEETNDDHKNDSNHTVDKKDDEKESKPQSNGNVKTSISNSTKPTIPNGPKKSSPKLKATKSFKSIYLDQKLKPLSAEQETAPSATIQKTVKKEKKRHALLDKPWNRHKSNIWPKNRISMTYELKKWLIDNKFDKFASKLYHFGIESMDDLHLLTTESMIEDLCGRNGVKMTIIYRRKFIKKVLTLNQKYVRKQRNNDNMNRSGSLMISINGQPKKRQFKYEMEAVQALSSKIQESTKSIRLTKKLQSEIEEQTKKVKESVIADFDELIKVIAMRKKQILSTIDTRHKITVNRLDEQYKNICDSAKTLLITQKFISPQIRDTEATKERKDDVIEQIETCLEECDKYTPIDYGYVLQNDLKYQDGARRELKNYGKLIYNEEQLL